ncbi:hypothetical protein C0J52_02308 [Blattella germanica]|nr:hypothetical protein C0J52_02308 [Blattella germanica]
MCGKVPHLIVGDVIYEQCRRKISILKVPVINEEASGSQKSGRQIINRRRTFTEEGKSTGEGEYNPEDINVPM